MRSRLRVTAATAALLACGAAATAVQASEGRFNTPMDGSTKAGGRIGSNYTANTRKLRNLFVEWGCRNDSTGAIYTSAAKPGKVYAKVSSTGKFHATVKTNYGVGDNGIFDQSLGKATIIIDGKMKSRPGRVTGSGTISIATAQCKSGTLKFSWKGTNGT